MHGFRDEREYAQAVADAKTRVKEVTPSEAARIRERGEAMFLDVREPNEWNLFHIPGAIHVPLGEVAQRVKDAVPADRPIIVYCARGNRSALAADTMRQLGYGDVSSMASGIRGWVDAGGDVEE
ncbi:MAG TPA: rhodanese-like domain-containing protein [Gemmatimonadaceae bacterium]|nr:rhodanese-like domain-containing protein [Gemmatimonadaceae bacterium]